MFRYRRGRVTAAFGEEEADLLRRLIDDYRRLVEVGSPASEDPVLKRLFPSASLDDPEIEDQWRELAADDLAAHKNSTAATALESLSPQGEWDAELSDEQMQAWLVLLTDLRLVIGVRLGVTEETMSAPVDASDPEQWPMAVLHYLGAIQESLVVASGRTQGF